MDSFFFKLVYLWVADSEGEAEKVMTYVVALLSELGWGKVGRGRLGLFS